MGEWVEFHGGAKFRLIEAKNKYTIEQLQDDGSAQIFAFHNKPFTLQQGESTTFYKAFLEYAESNWSYSDVQKFKEIYRLFCKDILDNRVTADELEEIQERKKKASEEKSQNIQDKYYERLYGEFKNYQQMFDLTPLELIVACSRCLVADSVREVIRAFVGYFQTINNIKATNVIAIGSPASGKSFILDVALSMMPQENIHYGVMTESAFFESFDGMDLTGHIFALGDMGGVKDDEKSIAFRDLLKALSTDGEVSRTISKKVGNEVVPVREVVSGHPALTYSTANEEIVNDQEKSRSVILTPQPINPHALSVFDFIMENNGRFRTEIEEIYRVRDSIRGLVYCFNYQEKDGFVNPYEYNIIEVLEEKDDYNRKIQEYKATLKVVTLLDNPYSIFHDYYKDEDNKPTKSKLVFATKRNNLNAMNLFDAVNFLPDEARFGDRLLNYFDVFPLDEYPRDEFTWDDSQSFEEKVINIVTYSKQDWVVDDTGSTWKRQMFYNSDNGYFSEVSPHFHEYFFTVSTLKKRFKGKWFNQHKHYLSERLRKLYDEGVLIKLGQTPNRENVYGLSDENGSKISEKLPSFEDSSKITEFKHSAFDLVFPRYSTQWDEFIEFDSDKPIEKSLTESVDALYKLPFIKEANDV